MNLEAAMSLLVKGLTILPSLITAGVSIVSTVEKMRDVAASAESGSVTDEQIADLETHLDSQISDFNAPMA